MILKKIIVNTFLALPKDVINRIACLKFGHPALSSEFSNYALNTEFVSAVGMVQKNKITIRKLKELQN